MSAYLELTKPRITLLAALCAAAGFALASEGPVDPGRLAWTVLGTALAAAATGCLNQWLEADIDRLMRRTMCRPLPSGRVAPGRALAFGLACGAGSLVLVWKTNLLAWLLAAATLLGYLAVYTPLKRRTSWSTWIGAVPGAMPPLIGWAAAAGRLEPAAWTLFAVQYLWQIPHFLALAWLHREDYARAGLCVASVADPTGRALRRQIAASLALLLPLSLLPGLLGMAGQAYAVLAAALGAGYAAAGLRAVLDLTQPNVRQVFAASLVYLPAVLAGLVAL